VPAAAADLTHWLLAGVLAHDLCGRRPTQQAVLAAAALACRLMSSLLNRLIGCTAVAFSACRLTHRDHESTISVLITLTVLAV